MPTRTLATATDNSTQLLHELSPWLIALVVMVFLGGIAIMLARRHFRTDSDFTAGGYTLHDLRQMHARGDLSDEEFEKARAAMIAGVNAASVREDSTTDAASADTIPDVADSGSDESQGV